MMRKYILSLLLLAVLVFMAAGCHHKPTMREMGIVLDTLCSSSVATLTDSVGSPTCEVDIELIALQNKEYAPVMDSLIRSGILSPEYLSLTDRHIAPREAIDSFIKRYISDYRTFYSGLFTDEGDTAAASIGWKLRTSIEEGLDSTLCYRARINHRQGTISTEYTVCRNIDLPHKRILKLEDVFVRGYERPLSDVIAEQLMKQSGNKTLFDLHSNGYFLGCDVYPTSNFLLGAGGITFVYVAGEIANREKGEISVEVKYSKIKHLLRR